jgi:hypothetical protein
MPPRYANSQRIFTIVSAVCGQSGTPRARAKAESIEACGDAKSQKKQMEEEFERFLDENDVMRSVGIGYFGENNDRGAKALEDLEEGSIIMQLPLKLLISSDTADSSELGEFFDTYFRLFPSDSLLQVATFLMYEKQKETSFWRSYFVTLGDTFDTLIEWQPSERESFFKYQIEPEIESIRQLEQSIEDLHQTLCELKQSDAQTLHWFDSNKHTIRELKWSVGLITSRGFKVNGKLSVVPLADLLNHFHPTDEFPVTEYEFVEAFDSFVMKSCCDYETDQQVFNQYGQRSYSDLLTYYGFVDDCSANDESYSPSNPNDRLHLSLVQTDFESVAFLQQKSQFLAKHGIELDVLVLMWPFKFPERSLPGISQLQDDDDDDENQVLFDSLMNAALSVARLMDIDSSDENAYQAVFEEQFHGSTFLTSVLQRHKLICSEPVQVTNYRSGLVEKFRVHRLRLIEALLEFSQK